MAGRQAGTDSLEFSDGDDLDVLHVAIFWVSSYMLTIVEQAT